MSGTATPAASACQPIVPAIGEERVGGSCQPTPAVHEQQGRRREGREQGRDPCPTIAVGGLPRRGHPPDLSDHHRDAVERTGCGEERHPR